jgi:hypothetical protein
MGHIQDTIIKTWPTVDGEVIKTQINVVHERTTRGLNSTRYETEIEFRYTVGGKEYTARSTPGYSTARYSIMKRTADTYAPGTHHPIRYNPDHPNIIFFNAGYNLGFFFLPIMFGGGGLLLTVIGLITLKAAPAARPFEKDAWVGLGRPCQACGQALQPGHKFCSNCGRPVPAG